MATKRVKPAKRKKLSKLDWLIGERQSREGVIVNALQQMQSQVTRIKREASPCDIATAVFLAASEYETDAAAVLIAAHEVYTYANAVVQAAMEEMSVQCTPNG